MKQADRVEHIALERQGVVTTSQVSEAGIPRHVLASMVEKGRLTQLERGIYLLNGYWEDEFFTYSLKYKKGVFSHGSALYLHGLTDTAPERFTMTFPQGYNTISLSNSLLDVRRTALPLHMLGATELLTPSGNTVKTYIIERTLCDILRGSEADDSDRARVAFQHYSSAQNRDIPQLMRYAQLLRVTNRVQSYLKALL